jgi:hypothetical protein
MIVNIGGLQWLLVLVVVFVALHWLFEWLCLLVLVVTYDLYLQTL